MDHGHDHGSNATRRAFLLASLGIILTGCSSTSRSGSTRGSSMAAGASGHSTSTQDLRPVRTIYPSERGTDHTHLPPPDVTPPPSTGIETIDRTRWASGRPVPTLMDPMLPARYITIHHDGMTPFLGTTFGAVASRIDLIRTSHRNKQWGDIGYHYVVDRAGRVWTGRPLNFQGAHVKDRNEGNIGILNLGNFELQTPSDAQLGGLRALLRDLQRQHNITGDRIYSHREWAATACPGRNLQRPFTSIRSSL